MLNLMTMNVNLYEEKHGPWPRRRRVIEEAARAADVDLLALQAVRRHKDVEGGLDQGTQLADSLGLEHRLFRPAYRRDDGSEDGVALLSKRPLVGFEARELSTREGTEDPWPRVVLRTQVSASITISVVNAHLSWVPEQNEDNAVELVAFLEEHEGPTLVVGDFNATPDAPSLRRLRDAGYLDVWRRLRPGDSGFTFESHAPDKRIDYVLVTVDLASRLEQIHVVAGGEDGSRGSDHLGLVVTLDV